MSTERVNEVKIKLDSNGSGSVEVDGQDLSSSVVAISFSGAAGRSPRLEFTLMPRRAITVDASAKVTIDRDTAAALEALGWTPPPWDHR